MNCGDVAELDGRFEGQSAVVFGKGPSLEHFLENDLAEAETPLRVCINETCLLVPHPHFTFFVDPHNAKKILFPPNCNIVCPPSMVGRILHDNGNRILTFTTGEWVLPAYATAACSLAALCRWGISKVLLVGFDAFDIVEKDQHTTEAYPDSVKAVETKPRKNAYYEPINDQIRSVLARFPIAHEFYHRRLCRV